LLLFNSDNNNTQNNKLNNSINKFEDQGLNTCIFKSPDIVRLNSVIHVKRAHEEGDTIWIG